MNVAALRELIEGLDPEAHVHVVVEVLNGDRQSGTLTLVEVAEVKAEKASERRKRDALTIYPEAVELPRQ